MNIIRYEGSDKDKSRRKQNDRKVIPRQREDVLVDGDEERRGASGRMDCFCDLHEKDSDSGRKGADEPLEGIIVLGLEEGKEFRDAEAAKSADKMSTDEGARLSQRGFDGGVAENGGCALNRG